MAEDKFIPKFKIATQKGAIRVLRFEGYTDGRPSWRRATELRFWDRAGAEEWIAKVCNEVVRAAARQRRA